MLSVAQILKFGVSGSKRPKVEKTRKQSADIEGLRLAKINPDDSVSEEVVLPDLSRRRRKESLDQIESELNKQRTQKLIKRNTLMKRLKIKIDGDNAPPLLTNFTKMMNHIEKELLLRTGYTKPTPVQMAAIPAILQQRNVIAIAPTGSGKTAAYGLPILENLKTHKEGGPRCLVFSPAAELTQQIYKDLKHLNVNKLNIKSIQHMNRDKLAFKQAWQHLDILVCSPLKFLKLHHKVDLACIEYMVLDEADKYFELGLLKQIQQLLKIFEQTQVSYAFFSATLPEPVEQIFKELVTDPVKIQIGGRNHVLSSVDQKLTYCSNEYGKIEEIKNLINEGQITPPVLIFVQSKSRSEALLYEMQALKAQTQLRVSAIHGSMDTSQREEIVDQFHRGQIWILICTDMMARGIDFKGVKLVINYDFPSSMITYVHRVGRTGRAGQPGRAITFFTDEDKPMLRSLANVLKVSGCAVPEWLFDLKPMSKVEKKRLERFPVKRERIEDQ